MPFSQIIPPSLSHRVQKTVIYICVSFAVFGNHTVPAVHLTAGEMETQKKEKFA